MVEKINDAIIDAWEKIAGASSANELREARRFSGDVWDSVFDARRAGALSAADADAMASAACQPLKCATARLVEAKIWPY
jgi:hypothetical protein